MFPIVPQTSFGKLFDAIKSEWKFSAVRLVTLSARKIGPSSSGMLRQNYSSIQNFKINFSFDLRLPLFYGQRECDFARLAMISVTDFNDTGIHPQPMADAIGTPSCFVVR